MFFIWKKFYVALGAETWWEDHDLYLDCTHADGSHVPEIYSGRMRSSIILLGPILARNQQAEIGYPGGCVIGKRPVDLHLYVLRRFGAEIKEEEKKITVSCKKLCGTGNRFFEKECRGNRTGDSVCDAFKRYYHSSKLCQRAGNRMALPFSECNGGKDRRSRRGLYLHRGNRKTLWYEDADSGGPDRDRYVSLRSRRYQRTHRDRECTGGGAGYLPSSI